MHRQRRRARNSSSSRDHVIFIRTHTFCILSISIPPPSLFYNIIVLDMRILHYNRGLRDLGMRQASTLTRRWSYQSQPAQRLCMMIRLRKEGGGGLYSIVFCYLHSPPKPASPMVRTSYFSNMWPLSFSLGSFVNNPLGSDPPVLYHEQ